MYGNNDNFVKHSSSLPASLYQVYSQLLFTSAK